MVTSLAGILLSSSLRKVPDPNAGQRRCRGRRPGPSENAGHIEAECLIGGLMASKMAGLVWAMGRLVYLVPFGGNRFRSR